jgi:hypothetical protein
MQTMESVEMTLQFAREREASLRRATLVAPANHSRRHVRRWLGRQLVRTGTWLENRRPMNHAEINETASP